MYNTRWHLYFLPVDVNFGTLNDVNFRRWPQADISLVSLFCCSFHLLHPSALCETRPLCPYKHLPEDLRYILVTSYLAKFCRVWIHRLLLCLLKHSWFKHPQFYIHFIWWKWRSIYIIPKTFNFICKDIKKF